MRKFLNVKFAGLLVIILIAVCPTLYMSGSFYNMNSTYSKDSSLKNMETIGINESKAVSLWTEDVVSDMDLYTCCAAFQQLDIDGIKDFSEKIKANKPQYKEILVFDKAQKLLSGSRYNLDGDNLKKCLQSALGGEIAISDVYKSMGNLYVYVGLPISTENGIVGALIGIVNIHALNDMVNSSVDDRNIECYIVDKYGMFLTDSLYSEETSGNKIIDLKKIKTNIDYSKTIPYVNYRGQEVYGSYFDVSGTSLTVIVEQSKEYNVIDSKKIFDTGKYTSLLQLALIAIMKKAYDYFFKSSKKTLNPIELLDPVEENKNEAVELKDKETLEVKKMVDEMLKDSFRKSKDD